jgi:hypothetical protein
MLYEKPPTLNREHQTIHRHTKHKQALLVIKKNCRKVYLADKEFIFTDLQLLQNGFVHVAQTPFIVVLWKFTT